MKHIFTFLFLATLFSCSSDPERLTIGTKEAGFVDGDKPQLDKPIRITPYKDGSVLFVDFNNNAIRVAHKDGSVSTIIGSTDKKGYKDGFADEAMFTGVHGVAYDKKNDIIYTISASNNVVRKITKKEGKYFVETIAGNQKEKGFQDGEALSAKFNSIHQILLDDNGSIYILDIGNAKVRMLKDGMVSTIAGNDSISPLKADFKYPIDMAFDKKDIVICDAGNANIYRVILNDKIETLELSEKLNMPHGITSDNNGTLYVADMGTNKILKIESDKKLTVVEDKDLNKPAAVLVDNGLLWIADLYNHQIKFIKL
ncbi:MAG: SMP-30/gluconolactonase/LRE family protein [Flavobacteriales bacterium]|nr:SMP-30/gluconolactonase/LRE family protein [Flavobacteriales bacterium]